MKKQAINPLLLKHAVLKVDGGTCFNCARAIEHAGARMTGIQDIQVDPARNLIQVDYDGRPETLDQVVALVGRLGYMAVPAAAES